MNLKIENELAGLKRMTVDQLRSRYAEVFGEPTGARHKEWLIKRIAWRLQALSEGDLTERARQRAKELAREADLRLSPPQVVAIQEQIASPARAESRHSNLDRRLPIAGTILSRPYKGQDLQVKVLAEGFEYEGQRYSSLSGLAKQITGSHCNGYLFFGLSKQGGRK